MAQLSTSGGGGGFASGSSGGGKLDWDTIIGAGVQLAGSLLNSRGARQANQMTRESLREQMQQDALLQRERLRAEMQTRQDDYQREVTLNRRAISPYRQMYSGPRFQFAEGQGPDAPIYNPLMEQGSLYQQLGQAPQMPWQQQQQPPRRG